MKKISGSRKKGFTLVELIAVMTIVAILALMIVPSITNYKHKAVKTDIISSGKVILNAVDAINAEKLGKEEIIKQDDEVGKILENSEVKEYLEDEDIQKVEKLIDKSITLQQLREYVNKKEKAKDVEYDKNENQLKPISKGKSNDNRKIS